MRKELDNIYRNQSLIYKTFLTLLTTVLVVYLFPKGGKFKYDFQKGKVWQEETLYAPFDFAIHKTDEEIESEKKEVVGNLVDYFKYDTDVYNSVKLELDKKFPTVFTSQDLGASRLKTFRFYTDQILDSLYEYGIVAQGVNYSDEKKINLVEDNQEKTITFDEVTEYNEIKPIIKDYLDEKNLTQYENKFYNLFFDVLKPNVTYDQALTDKTLEQELSKVTTTRGNIELGKKIIAKGEVVEGEKYEILDSLRKEYQSQLWSDKNYILIVFGYSILVALAFLMLLLFLKKYRPAVFENNTKITFIFFNVFAMILLTTFVVKYNVKFLYAVPVCILPLILKTFFDPRLGFFVHVLTVLLLGFIVPSSFEYVYLQIIAGIVTTLTISELHKRANLFISVAQITAAYIIVYFAFYITYEGSLEEMSLLTFGMFIFNGLATLAALPLVYIYEKVFGLVSDVSLLELTDTNSRLLKQLSDKAPGTFHHSLQVANIAEAAANEISANSMLVRVAALYHDIGKMNNPMYFTENQTTSVNPHNDLDPKESAKIIINHVIEGIEMAKKYKLPDRIIDFIRTHHGTSVVYYFYKKEESLNENVNIKDFQYPGPTPFSKETAILMMADAVEAASKSLKNPTFSIIDNFVEKIVNKQMDDGQFLNANITFKEIQAVKKVMKKKLTNIYHLRVEYPE